MNTNFIFKGQPSGNGPQMPLLFHAHMDDTISVKQQQ